MSYKPGGILTLTTTTGIWFVNNGQTELVHQGDRFIVLGIIRDALGHSIILAHMSGAKSRWCYADIAETFCKLPNNEI